MHPQSRLAFHCASAGLIQSEPLIKQAKKNTMPVGYGLPTDTKCFAHAGISRFILLSVARGREQCGDAGRGQESASFHRCLNVEHEQVFLHKKFPETRRRNFDVSIRNLDEMSAVFLTLLLEERCSEGAMRIETNTFRPPAPMPRADWPGSFDLVRTLWNNPIEAWTQAHFEQPIVRTHLPFADIVAVNDPAAVRRVLSDNAENYCKDRFQKRMLTVLSNGLLTAENEQWRSQRRLIAPLFTMTAVKSMASTMSDTIAEFIASWASHDGIIDIAEETTDLALAVLERTIFSG